MSTGFRSTILAALAWMVFPLVPALLGLACHHVLNFGGVDPTEWTWQAWLLLAGPLVGYGFLVGATLGLPDDPDRPRLRRWLARRSVLVAVGPWLGLATGAVVYYVVTLVGNWVTPRTAERIGSMFAFLNPQFVAIACLGWLAYAWVVVAFFALRRARRRGRLPRSLQSGLVGAIAFAGSLFGTFWVATSAWRDYFFDKRIVPVLLVTATLALATGCAGTVTYGEVRRREFFQALLTAWLLGAALAWRWWGRPRSRPAP